MGKSKYNILEYDEAIYKFKRINSIFEFIQTSIAESPNVIDEEQLDDALFELTMQYNGLLTALEKNFDDLSVLLRGDKDE